LFFVDDDGQTVQLTVPWYRMIAAIAVIEGLGYRNCNYEDFLKAIAQEDGPDAHLAELQLERMQQQDKVQVVTL
jgi:hypothetical protein